MNQNYIQAINLACIIYLIYLILGIRKDSVLKSLQMKKIDGLIENPDQVKLVNQRKSSTIASDVMSWIDELKGKGMKHFSQNDEDGAIEAIFYKIGTKDKIYVEFGVEDCAECNTRYLRSVRKLCFRYESDMSFLFQREEKLEREKVTFAGWRK